jgi:hypothetical protein
VNDNAKRALKKPGGFLTGRKIPARGVVEIKKTLTLP